MKNIICAILTVLCIWMLLSIGAAYEEHLLCMNGAIEHCIPEDFQ